MMFKYGQDRLTCSTAIKIARGEAVGYISDEQVVKIRRASDAIKQVVETERAVYGINTGFGPLCTTIIRSSDLEELQENLIKSHSAGVGKPLDILLSKLMLVLKIHNASMGYSGVRLTTLKRLMWHLEADLIPVIPSQGSVGASGDLAPLSHCFLPLLGLGKVWENGVQKETSECLEKHNLMPIKLAAKEGLALINGTQYIAAHAIAGIDQFGKLLSQADFIAAIHGEAMQISSAPFDERLHQVRPFPGNQHVAHRLYSLIHDSEINSGHRNCSKVQDPYSFRCIPQVHGSSRDAWLHLKERVEIEINAVTDNPLVFDEDIFISGGNFHGQPLAMTLDYLCIAASELGSIAERRIYFGLHGNPPWIPKLLIKDSGLNSGFMILQYTAAALVSENKTHCYPASADSIPTSLGQEDHVSMGSISGRKLLGVLGNVEKIQAIELMAAAQAIEFLNPLKPHSILTKMITDYRTMVSFVDRDRIYHQDIEASILYLKENRLYNLITKAYEEYKELRSDWHDRYELY